MDHSRPLTDRREICT